MEGIVCPVVFRDLVGGTRRGGLPLFFCGGRFVDTSKREEFFCYWQEVHCPASADRREWEVARKEQKTPITVNKTVTHCLQTENHAIPVITNRKPISSTEKDCQLGSLD
jgi:hypothetical protein